MLHWACAMGCETQLAAPLHRVAEPEPSEYRHWLKIVQSAMFLNQAMLVNVGRVSPFGQPGSRLSNYNRTTF